MSRIFLPTLIFILFWAIPVFLSAQEETVLPVADTAVAELKNKNPIAIGSKKDTVSVVNRPKIAAIRSAILPGLGQIYNKKYWKLPIVYGALGTTAGVFFYNLNTYKDLKFAYAAKYKASLPPPQRDSTDYFKIKPELLPLSPESLRFNRDEFRRNVDYSALIFLLLWGLNVVDAAVDAHLKNFDVGPDLSLQVRPGYSPMAGTNGVSVILNIGK